MYAGHGASVIMMDVRCVVCLWEVCLRTGIRVCQWRFVVASCQCVHCSAIGCVCMSASAAGGDWIMGIQNDVCHWVGVHTCQWGVVLCTTGWVRGLVPVDGWWVSMCRENVCQGVCVNMCHGMGSTHFVELYILLLKLVL